MKRNVFTWADILGVAMANSDIVSEDVRLVLSEKLDWPSLSGKVVVITGANGMLASYLVEVLLTIGTRMSNAVRVVALVRDVEKAQARFVRWRGNQNLLIRKWDFESRDLNVPDCHIVVHAASIPRPDSRHPVDVIGPNVIGTWNLLHYVHEHCKSFEQFVFFSSGAVYGDEFTDAMPVDESRYFAVDSMRPESCYAEAKRMGENICVSFMRQHGIQIKILRYAHTYGPGMDLENDPRSFVYFIRCALEGHDIELLTKGDMIRHFCYISDATAAFFRVLFKGVPGEAYNIANDEGGVSICDLASMIAKMGRREIQVRIKSADAADGYAPQRYVFVPDIGKLRGLGFAPTISPFDGFRRVISDYLDDHARK